MPGELFRAVGSTGCTHRAFFSRQTLAGGCYSSPRLADGWTGPKRQHSSTKATQRKDGRVGAAIIFLHLLQDYNTSIGSVRHRALYYTVRIEMSIGHPLPLPLPFQPYFQRGYPFPCLKDLLFCACNWEEQATIEPRMPLKPFPERSS